MKMYIQKRLLQEGDIIELKKGHQINAEIPAHFFCVNKGGVFDELYRTVVTIGENLGGMDTDFYAGRYVVYKTSFDGGGTGHGPHDVYPDGHHVWCRRLNGPENDGLINREYHYEVDFYQSGSFRAMIEDIEPVGKATAIWIEKPNKGEENEQKRNG